MVSIRKVKARDADEVKGLISGILESEFPGEERAYAYQDLDAPHRYYAGKRDVFYVAENDGHIVGTIAIKEDDPTTALLRRVFVGSGYRGKGYGLKLLKKAIRFCEGRRYKKILFHGTDRMETALKLCLSNGFKEKDIILNSDLKIVILEKSLNNNHGN
jgi:GNAT superfamily N-acetyltransferase